MPLGSKRFLHLLQLIGFNLICFFIVSKRINVDQPSVKLHIEPPLAVQIPLSVYSLSKSLPNDSLSIPTRLKYSNLFVQQVRASRSFSGGSAIFFLKGQNDDFQDEFWCLFDEDLITPVYYSRIKTFENNDELTLFECHLPESIRHSLWFNRTEDRNIRIYLSTSTEILLHAFLTVPWSSWTEENEQSITLCTPFIDLPERSLFQWIDFHRSIGISKFVIYSFDNENHCLEKLVQFYDEDLTGLIDIIPWNVSFVGMTNDCFTNYADLSEWIGMFDLTDYLIPPISYDTLTKFFKDKYKRQLQSSVSIEIRHFFSSVSSTNSNDKNIFRWRFSSLEQNKYLYRPRSFNRFFRERSSTNL